MQNLVPPFVWSLKYSTPVSVKNDVGICFEEYFQYFGINPEEDCSEYGLLQRATERRKKGTTVVAEPTRSGKSALKS